jgi:phage terminase large subunit-like protein
LTKQQTRTAKKKSGSSDNYWFDSEKVEHVINWIQTYCTHPVGDLQGEPLILPQWFIEDVVRPVFGWKKPNGFRKIKEVYEEIPSGNAKSTLSIALALYCLCADKQRSPKVYCVAGSKEQAGIIFNGAKIMIQQNATLSSNLKIHRNVITVKNEFGNGLLMAISADSDLQEGLNPTAIFLDELHVQRNANLYNNLKKNQAKRKEPLLVVLTTAGVVFTFAHEHALKARKVRDGLIKAPSFHVVIHAADPNCDPFDEEVWKAVNPGRDYLDWDSIREAAEDAKKSAVDLSAFKRYRLNIWVAAAMPWMGEDQWMKGTACESLDEGDLYLYRNQYLTPELLKGRECIVGLDLSSNRDTSSCSFIFPPATPGERIKILIRVYIPEGSLLARAEKETPKYMDWAEDGSIVVTIGEKQDQDQIYEDIKHFSKGLKIIAVAYDPWNAGQIVSRFEKDEIETKAYKQDYPSMNMPMREIENALSKGMIEHGGHPLLSWHCANTQSKTRTIGGAEYIMPTKSSEVARIDGIVATLIGYGLFIWKMKEKAEEESKSIVKNQGIVSIKLRR